MLLPAATATAATAAVFFLGSMPIFLLVSLRPRTRLAARSDGETCVTPISEVRRKLSNTCWKPENTLSIDAKRAPNNYVSQQAPLIWVCACTYGQISLHCTVGCKRGLISKFFSANHKVRVESVRPSVPISDARSHSITVTGKIHYTA